MEEEGWNSEATGEDSDYEFVYSSGESQEIEARAMRSTLESEDMAENRNRFPVVKLVSLPRRQRNRDKGHQN